MATKSVSKDVAQDAIRGDRPDMSRNEGLAGQTVQQGKWEVTYNENGYAEKAINTERLQEIRQGNSDDDGGGGGGGGGGGSSSSYDMDADYYEALQPTDLTEYLNDMYAAYNEAQQSALKSTYEQNLADLQRNAAQIPGIYQTARNEAASQNDIARRAFQEYANARGLNSGTSGQAELANSAVLQGNLADISTQESDALADNALQQQQLAIQYRNAAVQAQAEGNYQLAQALYNEYVRQDNAAMQTAQLAQEQANWEAQFNAGLDQWNQQFQAQQQQYQDSMAAQQKEYAYNLAMTMLSAGVMPDTNTLNSAGISAADAMNLRLNTLSSDTAGGGRGSSISSDGGNKSTENTLEEVPGPGIEDSEFQSQLMALSSYLSRASGSRLNSQSYRDGQFEKAKQLYETLWAQANATQRERLNKLMQSYDLQ